MSEETARLWEVLGTWFSGIGAFAAVIVSLYLARQQRVERLKITADIHQVAGWIDGKLPEMATITVTNHSQRRVTVNHVGWQIGFFRKRYFVQTIDRDGIPFTNDVPIDLEPGQVARFMADLHRRDWIGRMCWQLDGWLPALSAATLMATVGTTLGLMRRQAASRGLRTALVQELARQKAAGMTRPD